MPRTLSEQQKRAMQAGRERAARKAQRERVEAARAWLAWCKRDAEITRQRGEGRDVPREHQPALPEGTSDEHFRLARGEAA